MKRSKPSFTGIFFNRITPFALLAIAFGALVGNWWPTSATGDGGVPIGLPAGVVGKDAENGQKRVTTETPIPDSSTSLFSVFANRPSRLPFLLPDPPPARATVRRGFNLNGRIEGSVQQILGQNTVLNSNAVLTGDLMVPGSPTLVRNGSTTFGGTMVGTGSAQPSNYSVTMNSGSQLGRLLTRTDPVTMPTVPAPPAPTGTRNVTINNSGQSPGDFATLRNLTLNSNVGNFPIPYGTYGSFIANNGSGFVLGVAGSTQPAVYNFSSLTLNSGSQLQVVGPVVITVGGSLTLNSSVGSSTNPTWLQLKLSSGGVTLNSGSALYGAVTAPSGTVTINSTLVGNVSCDRLTVNTGGLLNVVRLDVAPPTLVVEQPAEGVTTNARDIVVSGTFSDESNVSILVNDQAAQVEGNRFTHTLPFTQVRQGSNTFRVRATDSVGNITEVIRTFISDRYVPTIQVEYPTDYITLHQPQITVTGTVDEHNEPFTITVNDTPATITDRRFSATIPLIRGRNVITARVSDPAGNMSSGIQRYVDYHPDATPPQLNVVLPAEGSVVNQAVVSGTVQDDSPTRVVTFGAPIPVASDGTFNGTAIAKEGINTITISAIDEAGNESPDVVRTFTLDVTPPELLEVEPASGTLVSTPTISMRGRASDNLSLASVKFNGVTAALSADGRFSLDNVAIPEGESGVTVTVTDTAGNIKETLLGFIADRTPPPAPQVSVSANPTRLSFVLVEGRTERNATIEITGGTATVTTQASYKGYFMVKVDLRPGSNPLSITAKDLFGNRSEPTQLTVVSNPNLPPPPTGVAFQINAASGNSQRGLAGSELPRPFVAIVTDRVGSPVPGATVQFRRAEGLGQFVGGDNTFQATTGADGRAYARYVSGLDTEAEIIQANFTGNTSTPATFVAAVAVAPANAATSVSGVVLDQNMRALPNVIVRIGGQQTRTGTNGRFKVFNVSAGPHQLLELIGRDQVPFPGRWPNISYDIDVLSGTDNSLGRPLFLPRVNAGVAMPLDGNNIVTQDTSYELPVIGGRPPVKITAKAGTRVIFPPDVTDRTLSVTRITPDRIPMSLEDGLATNLYISVQPSGAVFQPPLEVSFPNIDNLPASSEVLLMSFDHDAGRYVRVGSAHVSGDGQKITSDPGSGISVGAWHAAPPPQPSPETVVTAQSEVTCECDCFAGPSTARRMGPNSDGNIMYIATVASSLGSLSMQSQCPDCAIRSIEFLAPTQQDTLFENPNNRGGGKGFFPDQNTLAGPANRTISVRINLTRPEPNRSVYLKSFDVRDSNSAGLFGNATTGGDNQGPLVRAAETTPRDGSFVTVNAGGQETEVGNLLTVTTDATGSATATFKVTMQPGDNFKIAAGLDQAVVRDNLTVNERNIRDGNNRDLRVKEASNQRTGVQLISTELLTIWRRLHFEVDSMPSPPAPVPITTPFPIPTPTPTPTPGVSPTPTATPASTPTPTPTPAPTPPPCLPAAPGPFVPIPSGIPNCSQFTAPPVVSNADLDPDRNYLKGDVVKINGNKLFVDVLGQGVTTPSTSLSDGSANRSMVNANVNNGRFQDGSIEIGIGADRATKTGLEGNGTDFIDTGGIEFRFRIVASGGTDAFQGSDVEGLDPVTGIVTLNRDVPTGVNYTGGTLTIAGVPFTIDGLQGRRDVLVREELRLPFLLKDDDVTPTPLARPTGGQNVGENTPFHLMQSSTDETRNIFAVTYIVPVYDLSHGPKVPRFNRNINSGTGESDGQLCGGKDYVATNDYWAIYVQGAFQPEISSLSDPLAGDGDPDPVIRIIGGTQFQTLGGEINLVYGLAPQSNQRPNAASTQYNASRGTFGALIFLEAIRELGKTFTLDTTPYMRTTIAHEVGHLFGLKHPSGKDSYCTATLDSIMNGSLTKISIFRFIDHEQQRIRSVVRPVVN